MLLFAILTGAPAHAQPAPSTLFVNVNVVPMDRERVLRGQSVLIRDGRIAAIGPRVTTPEGARVIDGRGAYLLPGLADMHVHVRDRETLAMLLASGITTALDLGEAPNPIVGRTRASIERGDIPGPRLFVALAVDGSPRFGHLVVPSPEAAGWAVRIAHANGYDFIKVYSGLSPAAFQALSEEGRAIGLPIVGHSVESVGLERQIAAGQAMVAHLEEFIYTFFRRPEGGDPHAAPDDAEIARAVDFARRSGVTITADLATYQAIAAQWGRPEQVQAFLRVPEVRFLSPADRIDWRHSGYQRRTGSLAARAAFLARFVRALAAAEVPLIAGTDSPTIPGLVAGFALHRNLAALEDAGLSRYQALATATAEPGRFIARSHPRSEPFGTVAEGMRADLLLVAENPLDNLSALQRPIGVMAAGRWHDAEALAAMRQSVALTYTTTP
ncbi:amidohydrolase family protein [Sphingosinicella sp. CPCC 101087]|uniref:amidohydrolase family protein n=1 Tax=Sphingosinicella sp. CPCC 101087 TaxID=2497754 RepID=UPI001FB1A109|nr:amidohydrolase family protein [Sphingosinicella sp. CPCC 101087]